MLGDIYYCPRATGFETVKVHFCPRNDFSVKFCGFSIPGSGKVVQEKSEPSVANVILAGKEKQKSA